MCGSPNADKSHNHIIVFAVKLPDLTPLYTNIYCLITKTMIMMIQRAPSTFSLMPSESISQFLFIVKMDRIYRNGECSMIPLFSAAAFI